MPLFDVRVSAEADIIELWRVEAPDADEARRMVEEDDGLATHGQFIENLETDNERERQVESVTPWDEPATADGGAESLEKVALDIIAYVEPDEDGDVIEAFSAFQERLAAAMKARADFTVSGRARELIDRMSDLIDGAIDTHIYSDDDTVPEDCPYHAAVQDSAAFLKVTTPEAPAYEAPAIGSDHVIGALLGAVDAMDTQIGQMKGMFGDEDGTIQDAVDAGDEARDLAMAYRRAFQSGPLQITLGVTGGVLQDISIDRPVHGLRIFAFDYDVEGTDWADLTMVQDAADKTWHRATMDVIEGDRLSAKVEAAPVTRPATQDDAK